MAKLWINHKNLYQTHCLINSPTFWQTPPWSRIDESRSHPQNRIIGEIPSLGHTWIFMAHTRFFFVLQSEAKQWTEGFGIVRFEPVSCSMLLPSW